ncbi:hypothetical protein BpHYR1_032698 [Brachionus plicatilis]|uniref:Uncharacterized protein n=1 Tax=Brachionus plicatilis TaxID=10195 RepID=A0A3M7Q3B2_BRAPC|nr:hypothetical protein BpHYR1_032698 [Brachionus plicatilis]
MKIKLTFASKAIFLIDHHLNLSLCRDCSTFINSFRICEKICSFKSALANMRTENSSRIQEGLDYLNLISNYDV